MLRGYYYARLRYVKAIFYDSVIVSLWMKLMLSSKEPLLIAVAFLNHPGALSGAGYLPSALQSVLL